MDFLSACSVLDVSSTASWAEARAAWRRMASKHHPDRGGDAQAFRMCAAAWEIVDRELGAGGRSPRRKGSTSTSTPSGSRSPLTFGTVFRLYELRIDGLSLVRVGGRASMEVFGSIGIVSVDGYPEARLQVSLPAPVMRLGTIVEATLVYQGESASIRGRITSRSALAKNGGWVAFEAVLDE